jgi:hypothetical protein
MMAALVLAGRGLCDTVNICLQGAYDKAEQMSAAAEAKVRDTEDLIK